MTFSTFLPGSPALYCRVGTKQGKLFQNFGFFVFIKLDPCSSSERKIFFHKTRVSIVGKQRKIFSLNLVFFYALGKKAMYSHSIASCLFHDFLYLEGQYNIFPGFFPVFSDVFLLFSGIFDISFFFFLVFPGFLRYFLELSRNFVRYFCHFHNAACH